MISRWPMVIGSNVPGNKPMRIMIYDLKLSERGFGEIKMGFEDILLG
jgi:hypothetical protein